MELDKIYTDNYNNRVKVISGDTTGLNRKIVYAQFIDRVTKIATQKEFAENLKQNKFTFQTFAIWHWEYKNYTLLN